MNILLVFATNSGTTMMTAQTISGVLTQKGHTVTMKEAKNTSPEDITSAPFVILGSPSWDYAGKEGQPHEDYVPLIEKLKTMTSEGKPFAVFGLGDSSYKHFCGAVDVFEGLTATMKGKLVTPSLRIDKFYQDQTNNMDKINKWAEEVATKTS